MTQEEILQAFEGRWRIKKESLPLDSLKYEAIAERVKALCLDFFRTAILLVEGSVSCSSTATYSEVCDATAPFEKFWNLYDKKVGRPKCEKLWSKLTMHERAACLSYIPAYKQAQPDKQYRKNPDTFLRNKSWNDELIYRNNGTDKQSQREQRYAAVAGRIAEYTKDTE